MDEHTAEIAKLQTAVWMADKLARLCRELLEAKKKDGYTDICRLEEEIAAHVCSPSFADALLLVGEENFYPDKLRVLCRMLEKGVARNIADARSLLQKTETKSVFLP